MKVKIISISKRDAFYPNRKSLKGKTGRLKMAHRDKAWWSGSFYCDSSVDGYEDDSAPFFFAYVKIEEIK